MNKIISLLIVVATFTALILAPVPRAHALFEGSRESACGAISGSENPQTCDTSSANTINTLIARAISILSFIVGVAAVIMIIVGGFRYVTSGGDSSSVNSAKDTILYAIIGLAVALLAQVFVKFVLNRLLR